MFCPNVKSQMTNELVSDGQVSFGLFAQIEMDELVHKRERAPVLDLHQSIMPIARAARCGNLFDPSKRTPYCVTARRATALGGSTVDRSEVELATPIFLCP
jgi:hypothetical protein